MNWLSLNVAALLCSSASAQLAFDVASIKPSGSPGGETISYNPGTLTMHNISLRRCIQWAWDAPRVQMSGPEWLPDEHYDISAKAADAAPLPDLRLMLRSLLAERLGVRVREVEREVPVYYLVPAKNGPRLHEATPKDATRFLESTTEGLPVFGRDKGLMVASRVSMADFAEQISELLQRPTLDRTGLKSRYDIRLDPAAFMTTPEGDSTGGRVDPMSMILTAIPAQLGLKVESGKDTVRFWIVEAAHKIPSGN